MTENVRPKLVIVGDSLFAEIAYEYFVHDSAYEPVAFAVEAEHRRRETLFGLPVVDFEALPHLYSPAEHSVYVALVYTQLNRLRARLMGQAKQLGYSLASYVSSRAFVWSNVEIGEHCFIFENNVVQPFVKLGDNVILWSGNHVGHHSLIHANCFVASHVVISGSVEIGENTFIGVNATLVNDISVGRDVWIGPHVTLTRDVPAGAVYRPARSERRQETAYELFGVDV